MPFGWADTLRCAHTDVPEFGVIGCWRFPEEDFVPESANKKIEQFNGKHKLMQNCWVEGSGYLMKRQCLEVNGLLKPEQSFTDYCVKLAAKGWVNGWYYPFLYQEHMDDPRSPNTLLKSDDDFKRYMPLTAINFGLSNIEQWLQFLRKDALKSQTATCDPKYYSPLRAKIRRVLKKIRNNDN